MFNVDMLSTTCSDHARRRGQTRNISLEAMQVALDYGRTIHHRGACYYVIGRQEVDRLREDEGLDISKFNGVHVVCNSINGNIITVFRDCALKYLSKPYKKKLRDGHIYKF